MSSKKHKTSSVLRSKRGKDKTTTSNSKSLKGLSQASQREEFLRKTNTQKVLKAIVLNSYNL